MHRATHTISIPARVTPLSTTTRSSTASDQDPHAAADCATVGTCDGTHSETSNAPHDRTRGEALDHTPARPRSAVPSAASAGAGPDRHAAGGAARPATADSGGTTAGGTSRAAAGGTSGTATGGTSRAAADCSAGRASSRLHHPRPCPHPHPRSRPGTRSYPRPCRLPLLLLLSLLPFLLLRRALLFLPRLSLPGHAYGRRRPCRLRRAQNRPDTGRAASFRPVLWVRFWPPQRLRCSPLCFPYRRALPPLRPWR